MFEFRQCKAKTFLKFYNFAEKVLKENNLQDDASTLLMNVHMSFKKVHMSFKKVLFYFSTCHS